MHNAGEASETGKKCFSGISVHIEIVDKKSTR